MIKLKHINADADSVERGDLKVESVVQSWVDIWLAVLFLLLLLFSLWSLFLTLASSQKSNLKHT